MYIYPYKRNNIYYNSLTISPASRDAFQGVSQGVYHKQ